MTVSHVAITQFGYLVEKKNEFCNIQHAVFSKQGQSRSKIITSVATKRAAHLPAAYEGRTDSGSNAYQCLSICYNTIITTYLA